MITKIISSFIVILVGVTLLSEMTTFYNGLDIVGATFEEKPHKQTYEEFVQERLNVERMMR